MEPTPENATRVHAALRAFGAPFSDLSVDDLTQAELGYQIGVIPRRFDILTSLTGLMFPEAWEGRVVGPFGETSCAFLGRAHLVRNKRALGRPRDLADLEALGEWDGCFGAVTRPSPGRADPPAILFMPDPRSGPPRGPAGGKRRRHL